MTAKTRFTIINLVGLCGILLFWFNSGPQAINLQLFGTSLAASPGVILLVSYLAGALIGGASIVPFVSRGQKENVEKLKVWQEQDAKLALEVQSDREKQLEAKIATLESALKQALKK